MENIHVLAFLSPIVMIAFSVGLVLYWKFKKRFTAYTLFLSLVAFAGAIALKTVFQLFTAQLFYDAVGGSPFAMGIYVGLQTVIFEVGGAYVAAKFAFSSGKLRADDAESYGLGLAFWENGVLIGGLLLLNYISYYVILAGGGSSAQQLFDTLSTSLPFLFSSPSVILPTVGLAVLERISSLLVHFSWGLLCVFAVVFKRKRLLYLALPMGLVDFLVPYAGSIGSLNFEILTFGVCLLCLMAALYSTKAERKNAVSMFLPAVEGVNHLKSLIQTNFKRAIRFGAIYLILGVVLSLVMSVSFNLLSSVDTEIQPVMSQFALLMLPLYTVLGSLGGLMVFVSDRTKGVYEYLIAYGVSVYEIFWSVLIASFGLVTLVLGIALAGEIILSLLLIGSIQFALIELLLIYAIPLSYASVAFMCMAGMIWSSLTVRIPGVNSPTGISTILGIGPSMVIVILSTFFISSNNSLSSNSFLLIASGVTLITVMLAFAMMIVANKKMNRERLLSDV